MSDFYLTPSARESLRESMAWSVERFGREQTKKYFLGIDKGFQYIADQHAGLPDRPELTSERCLMVYPVREHYVIYAAVEDGVCIFYVASHARDIQKLVMQNAPKFRRELAQLPQSVKAAKPSKRLKVPAKSKKP